MSWLLDGLSAGGDVAAFALVFLVWKIDRRLITLETLVATMMRREDSDKVIGLGERRGRR